MEIHEETEVPFHRNRRTSRLHRATLALVLVAATSGAATQLDGQDSKPTSKGSGALNDRRPTPANGEVVSELGKSAMYVHHAKNGDYWFGSNDRGVYRYDGKILVNFTTNDGLVSNQIRGIQEDRSGSLYFTTYEGISKFDGKSFTTLGGSPNASPTEWKKQPDDLWFIGPPDAGVVLRWDGQSLHRLEFPRTKLGDEHWAKYPRAQFPNAKYSPYDVYCILNDSKGNIWFGSTSCGVCRYDGKSFDWLTDKILTAAPVRSILEDKRGNYWFSFSGHGWFDGSRPLEGWSNLQERTEGAVVAGMSIVEDDDGKVWTAALGGGAYRHDGKQAVNYPIREGPTAIEVFAIYKDRRGVLWLGTHNGGAYRFNGKSFEKFRP